MSAKKNRAVVEGFNREVFVMKNTDAIDKYLHPDYKHSMGLSGRDAAKEAFKKALEEGRDFGSIESIATIADGEYVVQQRKNGVVVYRLSGGKIIEDSWYTKATPS